MTTSITSRGVYAREFVGFLICVEANGERSYTLAQIAGRKPSASSIQAMTALTNVSYQRVHGCHLSRRRGA